MGTSPSKLIEILRRQKRLGRNALVIGVLLLTASVYCFIPARQFDSSALHVPGRIVKLERRGSGRNGNEVSVYPVFTFVDQSGTAHVIHSSQTRAWSDRWARYAVGDTVEVLYLAGDPEQARLNDFMAIWGGTALLGAGGLLFMLVGAILWYYAVHGPVNQLASGKLRLPGES